MNAILALEIALNGEVYERNRGLSSLSLYSDVLLMYVLRHETGSIVGLSLLGGIFTSNPLLDVSFFITKNELSMTCPHETPHYPMLTQYCLRLSLIYSM